jgi:hypothetical protein
MKEEVRGKKYDYFHLAGLQEASEHSRPNTPITLPTPKII